MTGARLLLVLSVPFWALCIAGGLAVKGMAARGELPVLHLRDGAPFWDSGR